MDPRIFQTKNFLWTQDFLWTNTIFTEPRIFSDPIFFPTQDLFWTQKICWLKFFFELDFLFLPIVFSTQKCFCHFRPSLVKNLPKLNYSQRVRSTPKMKKNNHWHPICFLIGSSRLRNVRNRNQALQEYKDSFFSGKTRCQLKWRRQRQNFKNLIFHILSFQCLFLYMNR